MSHYIFYKIVCEDCPDYIYIGSTKSFRSRKYQHKTNCNNINNKLHNLKLYNKIRENGGWDKWNMIIIDEEDDLTFTQARIKEEELRLKYNGNLNSNKAYISQEEQKECFKEYIKKYRENNKDIIKEKKREYDLKYREKNKEKIKEYNEKNKEKIKEKIKEYNEKNKEKIKEKMREYAKQYYQKKKAEALNKE